MEKLFIYTLFLFIFAITFASTASADAIPPNSHSLNRCVKIVNLNEFPNVTLIGCYTGPMVDNYETYEIKNNECLTKGYKFNTLSIYWTTKDKTNTIEPGKILLKDIESYGGYIDENNPLVKEVIEYSIAGFNGDKLVLYKSKQSSEYNDGTPAKVQTFNNPLESENPVVTPSPEPNETSLWQKIICFFKRLFGGSCY